MTDLNRAQLDIIADMIAGKVIDLAIATPIIKSATPETKAELKEVLKAETTTVVTNQLNQEPWYKSTILVTQYVSSVIFILGIAGIVVEPQLKDEIVAGILAVSSVLAPIITIWARVKAKKGLLAFFGLEK